MTGFSIRDASIADIPLVRDLTFKVWPQTYQAILTPAQIDYMLDMMYSESSLEKQIREGCQFILVYADGEPVGFASYQEIAAGMFKLHKIYVLPSQQGKGTGRFFIEEILSRVKNLGGRSLQLQVNKHNSAKLFYEKIGFRVVDEADFDIGNGFFMNDYIMEIGTGN